MKLRNYAIAVALSLSLIGAKCPSLKKALQEYGLTELRPPSTLMGPGALVWVADTSPFTASVICPADKTLGIDFVPMQSPTVSTELTKATKRGISFNVDVSQFGSASFDASKVKNVTLSLSNAELLEVSDWQVSERSNQLDQSCLRAMQRRVNAGFRVTMVSQALKADIAYTVHWASDANMDISAKIAQLEQLSAHLGLQSSSVTDRTIKAQQVYVATKDDPFLAFLYAPDNIARADSRQSLLDAEMDGEMIDRDDSASPVGQLSDDDYWQPLEIDNSQPK